MSGAHSLHIQNKYCIKSKIHLVKPSISKSYAGPVRKNYVRAYLRAPSKLRHYELLNCGSNKHDDWSINAQLQINDDKAANGSTARNYWTHRFKQQHYHSCK